uniref:NADH dehydrogenase subunit 6 n=1 Tax=Metrocoris acutus TaxID=2867915 RepID=UPI002E7A927A|nr:NADH dehydrogenase subunit 6 [Metrocoris acutus]WPW46980.1 NADH dehydrogenase subunit 6 [Metrocoris acutus]
MKMIYMMIITLSTIMMGMSHPLSMGFNLILLTMMLSMIMNLIMKYSWYSYILVLVMLGGMLVLFMYMASIASNEIMKFSAKMTMIAMLIMVISITILKNDMYMNMNSIIPVIENQQNMSLMKLFNSKSSIITIMLAMYLLITMIYVIFITNVFEGPMRKKS